MLLRRARAARRADRPAGAFAYCLGEVADRAVDHGAAVARAGRRVDRIERPQLEDVLRVDRVGIAQPVLDLGDASADAAARARRASARARRHGLARSPACRARAPSRDIARRASALRPSALAGDRREPLQEARGHGRRAAELGGAGEDRPRGAPSACAKSCADRPMRRSGRSRPSSCRIGRLSHGSLRVSGGQVPSTSPPSTTRSAVAGALRAGPRCARARRPSGRRTRRVGDDGVEQVGIVARRDNATASCALLGDLVEGSRERLAVAPAKATPLPRRRSTALESLRDGAGDASEAAARAWPALRAVRAPRASASTSLRGVESAPVSSRARIGAMQLLASSRNVCERMREPALPGAGAARAAPPARERDRGACAPAAAEPAQRMLEQREQRHRPQPPSAASAASRANTPAGVSASGSPPESSTGTFQRASAASTRRASARSGVTRAAVLPRRVDRLAQRDRDGERFLLGVRGLDHRDSPAPRRA